MNKKIRNYLFYVVIAGVGLCWHQFGSHVRAFSLDDLFKDLEDMFTEPSKPLPEVQEPITDAAKKGSVEDSSSNQDKLKDAKTLFLEGFPPAAKDAKPGKAVLTLSKERIKAYNQYMNEFTKELKAIEKSVDTTTSLSPEFKRSFISFKKNIDEIVVADSDFRSKKTYMRVFFTQPFAPLRKRILDTINQMKSLQEKIARQIKSGSEEKIRDLELIEQLAQEDLAFDVAESEPLPKRGKRGLISRKTKKNTKKNAKDNHE